MAVNVDIIVNEETGERLRSVAESTSTKKEKREGGECWCFGPPPGRTGCDTTYPILGYYYY